MKEEDYQVMDSIVDRIVSSKEVQDLVPEFPNQWFLLEVLETEKSGKATLLKIIAHDPEKDVLREHLLDLEPSDRKHIFFFTDTENACEL